MKMAKERLDVLLVKRNLIETREKAKRFVMAGLVYSDNIRLDKPGMKVDEHIPLHVKGKLYPYVGRGGLKLEKALDVFFVQIHNKIMIDIGASTGGFTDCALQRGAKLSYAIDVGYNQLDWKLRNDDRVVVMERTNFRYVTKDMFTHGDPNFAAIDVSFISLTLILPVLKTLLQDNSDIIALIKPQFETKKELVGKKGIVRDKKVHADVLRNVIHFAKQLEFQFFDLTYSPITGGDGNIEFLSHFGWKKTSQFQERNLDEKIQTVVEESHELLTK